MTAITAITAQNTVGVDAVHQVPPETILAQVRAVTRDIGVDAVKVGMLGAGATATAVADALDELDPTTPVVVDPVMVAESGAILLEPEAHAILVERVIPRATVVTPNLAEARVLAGAGDDTSAEDLARAVHALGPRAVVVTGGHREEAADVFFDGDVLEQIGSDRHADGAAHGSGCTHSSVLAAQLALGASLLDAARTAKRMAAAAVRDGLRDVGAGAGPVDVLRLQGRAT
jgi:hydroxymethylpyrimidine/phosphomethylpyrimidine kinase